MLNKRILLGVTGGIAAYKSAELVRALKKLGADIRVVMTESAKEFITPLTLQVLSTHPVRDKLFDADAEMAMSHIELARWAELILIAPATANIISKLANGLSDDLLSTVCLATESQIMIAPSMNRQMWENKNTQENLRKLKQNNIIQLGPEYGDQACGEIGLGRLLDIDLITESITKYFNQDLILKSKKILITAGPTREPIDPVRFLTNHSSGKMGYALARAAVNAGAEVTLISGPTHLEKPQNLKQININTAEEMYDAVMENIEFNQIFISTAAVADYRPSEFQSEKIKKTNSEQILNLKLNKDILLAVSKLKNKPFLVGFAAETHNLLENATQKLKSKNLDIIIANQVGLKNQRGGFDSDENEVIILSSLLQKNLHLADTKENIAIEIINLIGDKIHA